MAIKDLTVLEKVKTALRIKSDAYNTEIQSLIAACKADLFIAGVESVDETDALTAQAIIIYCKAHFGYDENSERFRQAYESLKMVMALAREYEEDVTEVV